jgi:hypothetical protein
MLVIDYVNNSLTDCLKTLTVNPAVNIKCALGELTPCYTSGVLG